MAKYCCLGLRRSRVLFGVFVLMAPLFASAAAPADAPGGAANTASFSIQASAQLTIAGLADGGGVPLAVVPAGFQINPSADGPATTVELSGTGALNFAGSFTTAGAGLTASVQLASDVSGTAVPGGVADGFETAAGGIQFINNSGAPVQVSVNFASAISGMGSVTDPALESVPNVFYDVEFSQSLGGAANSPCTTTILSDEEVRGLNAPPSFTIGPLGTQMMRMVTIPDSSTCSYNVLVQAGGRAVAMQPVPFGSRAHVAVLALLLLLVGVAVIRRASNTRFRHA